MGISTWEPERWKDKNQNEFQRETEINTLSAKLNSEVTYAYVKWNYELDRTYSEYEELFNKLIENQRKHADKKATNTYTK